MVSTSRLSAGPMEIGFLGWHRPLLELAARRLVEEARGHRGSLGDVWDFGDPVLVVPGRRAGRRLLEWLVALVEQEGGAGLVPPRVVTPGALPELLAPPRLELADPTLELVARAEVLRGLPTSVLEALLPLEAPSSSQHGAWLTLARELETFWAQLSIEGWDVARAHRALAEVGQLDGTRWRALEQIERRHDDWLARRGRVSVHRWRCRVFDGDREAAEPEPGARVVLIGISDLSALFRRLLEGVVSEGSGSVRCWVGAPESERSAFDAWGLPRRDVWTRRPPPLEQAELRVADRPSEQWALAADLVAEGLETGDGRAGMTVGVVDASEVGALQDALRLRGVASHGPDARPPLATRPGRLLQLLLRYVRGRGLRDLAALARHPDFDAAYAHRCGAKGRERGGSVEEPPSESAVEEGPEGSIARITRLDRYARETMVARVTPDLPAPTSELRRAVALVRALDAFVDELLGLDGVRPTKRPLDDWAATIRSALEGVYGPPAHPDARSGAVGASVVEAPLGDELEAATEEALRRLGRALTELERSGSLEEGGAPPAAEVEEVLEILLARLQWEGRLDLSGEGPIQDSEVELLGWLELLLDDAPTLVVTQVNEGQLPESVAVDGFLPESARGALGLVDARRRLARDTWVLTHLLHSRPRVVLIAGRRSRDGDPLRPSRLWLGVTTADEPAIASEAGRAVAERLELFYGRPGADHPATPAESLRAVDVEDPAAARLLRRIRPGEIETPLPTRLPVTAVRDYLHCPYRFWLRHVMKLDPAPRVGRELDGGSFGRLAHAALERFARGEAASSERLPEVQDALEQIVTDLARERLGARPSVTVQVQIERLRRRLSAFAEWQVVQVEEGWELVPEWCERRLRGRLPRSGGSPGGSEVSHSGFVLSGRVDRIDRHPDHGVRLIDYKTSDSTKTPRSQHGPVRGRAAASAKVAEFAASAGAHRWTDLQLPIYRLLLLSPPDDDAWASGGDRGEIRPVLPLDRSLELGYLHLSSSVTASPWSPADWSDEELADAERTLEMVLRAIAARRFWPPGPPPRWQDGLELVCADGVVAPEPAEQTSIDGDEAPAVPAGGQPS